MLSCFGALGAAMSIAATAAVRKAWRIRLRTCLHSKLEELVDGFVFCFKIAQDDFRVAAGELEERLLGNGVEVGGFRLDAIADRVHIIVGGKTTWLS